MPKAKTGNFTLRKIVAACPAHLAAHRLAALQRSGQYSELRLIQRGKSAFDIVGYRWPDKGTRRKLNIGRARKNPDQLLKLGQIVTRFESSQSKRRVKTRVVGVHPAAPGGPAYDFEILTGRHKGEVFTAAASEMVDNPNQYGGTTDNQVLFGAGGKTKVGWINRETATRYEITYKSGAQTKTVWRAKNKVKFQRTGKVPRLPNNCPKTANSPLSEAAKASAMFHQLAPRKVGRQSYTWPKSLAAIGPIARIEYVSDKFDGKARQYFHDFGPGAQAYFDPRPQSNGDTLLIIRGPFKIKPEGITG